MEKNQITLKSNLLGITKRSLFGYLSVASDDLWQRMHDLDVETSGVKSLLSLFDDLMDLHESVLLLYYAESARGDADGNSFFWAVELYGLYHDLIVLAVDKLIEAGMTVEDLKELKWDRMPEGKRYQLSDNAAIRILRLMREKGAK